uniref:Anticodon-binding domain-containing protein n=1 Tax=Bombyx mori TaxID=7091 RepID=A0A8R2HQQ9_BOMMO|nr:DNA polymerase accessory subunit isoform X1 [Bombyx mori]
MKTEILKVLNLKKFFQMINNNATKIDFTLLKPSQVLMKNIHVNWLRFTLGKTQKHMPVYLNRKTFELCDKNIPFGFITIDKQSTEILTHNLRSVYPEETSKLALNIIIPQKDIMKIFIQWQRYRKYWWSSITTTPSLFSINDMKLENNEANVDILAKFPFGSFPVERITITCDDNESNNYRLSCTMSLENALFIILLDGLSNYSKEEYLRLHRKITPYKIAFGFNFEDNKNKERLSKLVQVLFNKLEGNQIAALLPSIPMSLDSQIKENLQMGVTYTAIVDETTLENGIFQLLNSSTMLKEQVHVADFHEYASSLFNY